MACACRVSRSPAFEMMINEMLAVGMSMNSIEKAAKSKGFPIKGESVKRHFVNCLGGVKPAPNPVAIEKIVSAPQKGPSSGQPPKQVRDLARLVQQKAIDGLESGVLQVTVKDGLAATALLDKREARMEDQKFILGLTRLLSGAGHAGPRDVTVIDVTPNPALAPVNLRADD